MGKLFKLQWYRCEYNFWNNRYRRSPNTEIRFVPWLALPRPSATQLTLHKCQDCVSALNGKRILCSSARHQPALPSVAAYTRGWTVQVLHQNTADTLRFAFARIHDELSICSGIDTKHSTANRTAECGVMHGVEYQIQHSSHWQFSTTKQWINLHSISDQTHFFVSAMSHFSILTF